MNRIPYGSSTFRAILFNCESLYNRLRVTQVGIKVTPKPRENIQSTIRRLRKLCEREGILKELRRHDYYEKPSDKKRREKRAAERRARQSVVMKQKDRKQKRLNNDNNRGHSQS